MSTSIRGISRDSIVRPLVQISLDLMSNKDALETAAVAVEAGVDWIEIGTPLVLAEGLHAVRAVRKEFPNHPIVVDLKTMDGGYLEAQMMAEAGADAVVVMARAHDATVERVVSAGEDFGILVMGDDLGSPDRVKACARLEALGVGMLIHHIGFDQRGCYPEVTPSPLKDLADIVKATSVPVQAVGGLSIDEAVSCPELGASVVVFGAPLAIENESFTATSDGLFDILNDACARVHAASVVF